MPLLRISGIMLRKLFGSEQSVARIAQPGHNVRVIVLFIFLYKKGDKIERWFLNKFDSLRKRKKGEKIVGEIEEEKLPSEKKSAGESKIVGDVPHKHDE